MIIKTVINEEFQANAAVTDLRLWHERLAHVNVSTITDMAKKGFVNGLKISKASPATLYQF